MKEVYRGRRPKCVERLNCHVIIEAMQGSGAAGEVLNGAAARTFGAEQSSKQYGKALLSQRVIGYLRSTLSPIPFARGVLLFGSTSVSKWSNTGKSPTCTGRTTAKAKDDGHWILLQGEESK